MLPNVSKTAKKELKNKGVLERRRARKEDDEKVIKAKRRARIGTKSGYLVKKENNRRGAIEASKRRQEGDQSDRSDGNGASEAGQRRGEDHIDGDDWNGF